MSVRIKTLIVICLTFLALLGILYFTSRWFLFQDAIVTEEKSTTRDVTRLHAALDDQIAVMDANVGDWAPWDDTYEFISSGDIDYINSNLPNSVFTNLGVELMLFINNSGQLVFGKMVDLDSGIEIPVPESLTSELKAGSRLLNHKSTADKIGGILSLPEGPMIIASQPILTSLGEGPIRGTLIMGRRLNEAEIAKLSQRTQLSIIAFRYNDDGMPDDVALARNSLVGVKPIYIAPQNETVVSGYTLVNDVYGNPALILRVDTPREAFTQAKTSMRYLSLALLVIGFVSGLVTLLLLERMVIIRLTNLNSRVLKIGDQESAASRVEADGNDEIFVLATSVNSMLASLENSQAKERESEQHYQNLAAISPVGIFHTDQNGATTYVNPMYCHISGLSFDEALGDGWLRAVHPEDKENLIKSWQETTRLHKETSFTEYRFVRPNGTAVWVMGQAVPEMNFENQIIGYVGTITDITESKRAEDALRESEERYRLLVETLPDGVIVHSQGHIVFANPASATIIGAASPADLIGKPVMEFVHPDYRELALKRIQHSLSEGVPVPLAEEKFVRQDGRLIDVEVSAISFSYAGKPAMLTVFNGITERKQAEAKIQHQLEHLTALSAIDRIIAGNFDLKFSLSEILIHVTKELGIDAADILILNPDPQLLEFGAERGFRTQAVRKVRVRLGESYASRAVLERQLIQIPNLRDESAKLSVTTPIKGEDFVCYFGVPLITKGQVKGVLEVFHRAALEPDAEWFDFLNTLAGQAAIAIDNATLYKNLQRSNIELTQAYDATIEGWSRALDLRDKETEGHTQRVTRISMDLAQAMGVSDVALANIRRGALLHDIGKMGVPDNILFKSDKLTDEEWVIMRRHPTYAYEFLLPIIYLKSALDIPYCHHEKWDGTGYPRGLRGEQIPLSARIFAVVDVWDALTSDRPYRPAWTKEKVREHIRTLSATHFDPQVVDVFLQTQNLI